MGYKWLQYKIFHSSPFTCCPSSSRRFLHEGVSLDPEPSVRYGGGVTGFGVGFSSDGGATSDGAGVSSDGAGVSSNGAGVSK